MIFPTHFVVFVFVFACFLPGQTEFSFKPGDGHGDAKDRHGEATREKNDVHMRANTLEALACNILSVAIFFDSIVRRVPAPEYSPQRGPIITGFLWHPTKGERISTSLLI